MNGWHFAGTRTLARALVVALAVVCASGCASFDALFGRERTGPPALHGSPPADLPSPEGLRASSGELRSVPLKWDPLLSGEVAGYAVERALDRDGPFTRVAVLPGRLNTVTVDRTPITPAAEPEPIPEADAGNGAEADAGSGAEVDAGNHAEADAGNRAEADAGNGAEADAGNGAEADAGNRAEADAGNGAETDAGNRAEADAGNGAETDAGSGAEGAPESDAEREAERGAAADAGTGADAEERPEDRAKAAPEKLAVLDDGVTVFYRVRAYTPSGQLASNSSEVVAATTAPLPAPPEDLRAYSHQPRAVPLSWRASQDPNVTGYVVDRSPTYRGPFAEIARRDGRFDTIFVDRELGDLRVFYYRVSAQSSAGAVGAASEPVRAVTKPVPLPPIGLRVIEQRLGSNRLEWEPNVESDLREYRLVRMRDGSDAPERVRHVPAEVLSVIDSEVESDERVTYALVAADEDGLESATSDPIEVQSEGYALSATAREDGVHLEWRPRIDEGYVAARVVRRGLLRDLVLGRTREGRFVDSDVSSNGTYRYVVVLEKGDGSEAAPSSPVEIRVPDY